MELEQLELPDCQLDLLDLPSEIHIRIVKFLELADILNYGQVCRLFRAIIETNQAHLIRQWFYPNPLPGETIQKCIQRSNRFYRAHLVDFTKVDKAENEQVEGAEIEDAEVEIEDDDPESEDEPEIEPLDGTESEDDDDTENEQIDRTGSVVLNSVHDKSRILSGWQLFSSTFLIRHELLDAMFQFDPSANAVRPLMKHNYIQSWILGFIDLGSNEATLEWAKRGLDFWKTIHEQFPKDWAEYPNTDVIYTIDSIVLFDEFVCRYPSIDIHYELGWGLSGAVNIVKRWIETSDESNIYQAIERLHMNQTDPYGVRKDLRDRQAQIYLYLFEKLAPERTLTIMTHHITILYFDYSVSLTTLIRRTGHGIETIRAILYKILNYDQVSEEFVEIFARFIKEFDSQWMEGLILALITLLTSYTRSLKEKRTNCKQLFQHPDILRLVNRPEYHNFIIDRLTVIEEDGVVKILKLWPWINRADLYVKIVQEKGYYTRNFDFSDVLLDDQVTRDQINAVIAREGEESEPVNLLFDVPEYCWVSKYMARWLREINRARFNDPDD